MKNPYDILGVPQNADAQQLREARQALALKHEDDTQRMREIKDAYEAILLSRGGGNEALALLECVPEDQRGGEWHYRMGCVQRERGWLEQAKTHFRQAALFEPENRKYRDALKQAQGGRERKSVKDSISIDDTCENCCCGQLCVEGCCECICLGW